MIEMLSVFALTAVTGTIAFAATGWITGWLKRRALLDHPNERSSHAVPTPRGGGIGILAALLPAWALTIGLYPGELQNSVWLVFAGIAGLAGLSFLDDLRSLGAGVRLLGQLVAVSAALALLPADRLVAQGLLPLPLDRALTGLAWLWFVNLFNFMDGIDGISGVEATSIGVGGATLAIMTGMLYLAPPGLAIAAGSIGFLAWNWHPAKVFMGDVGSVPIGFALGWLLIGLAIAGRWEAALILPAYYWADATLTLLRRAANGEKIWRAHRSHFYQRAVQQGASHDWVARQVLVANVGLIFLAVASLYQPATVTLPAAGAVAIGLLYHLATAGRAR
jgi:UDP-N-acetylmuramyl pentapeptide phosphotransferase/UDP-N-acetylglucosamine-1-phosphate transferase